ncbi:MAG: CBS domain-containing protein [Aquincola sp.]|nr:CBS domain-containing protein [Aquincola sp.]MDH4288811.1 CBS domain-containing protein [Aquincola sp.]
MAAELDRSLSLAFMRTHPTQAAGVLEGLPPAEAAALFERVPARLGGTVLAAMLPRRAARCVEPLGDERLLELLTAMGTQPMVALLRHLPPAHRQRLANGLPTTAALATSLLLGYTEETVGAWADPDVVLLPADTRVVDALARMREAPAVHPLVFVAGADRRLVGLVPLTSLLQAPGGGTLASLMQRPAAVLAAYAPLAAAPDHPGWALSSTLPVVEHGDRLVGVMTRDALARAVRHVSPPTVAAPTTVPAMLGLGYFQALTGLLQGSLSLLPRVPPLSGTDE